MLHSQNKTCSNCGVLGKAKDYRRSDINPAPNTPESKIKQNYCDSCDNFTMWFMGEGVYIDPENIKREERNLLKWQKELELLERKKHILNEKINSNLLINWFYKITDYINGYKKLDILIYDIEKNKKEIILIYDKIKKLSDNSKSIDFYFSKKLKPKCLECHSESINKYPKHSCGGHITITAEIDNFKTSDIMAKHEYITYNEYGESTIKHNHQASFLFYDDDDKKFYKNI